MPPDGKPQKQKGRLRHAPGGHHVEQDLQKQTTGHHRHHLRPPADPAGQGAGMICCLASAACPLRDTAAPLAACGGREGAEVSFPLFPLREGRDRGHAATAQGSGHDYPDMRHAVCCSGAQPVRMKARMGIRKPPVTPGTVPRTGTKTGRRKKRGKKEEEREGPPDGSAPGGCRKRASGKSP